MLYLIAIVLLCLNKPFPLHAVGNMRYCRNKIVDMVVNQTYNDRKLSFGDN